jgi:hypothetical protein
MIRCSRMDGDMRRDHGGGVANTLFHRGLVVWPSKPTVDSFRVWSQNLVVAWDGLRGNMWHHNEACIDAKQSHEELVVLRCTNLKLAHFGPR